jgi:hypothetical protein
MPTTYQYAKTDGSLGTTSDQANAPGIDPKSGFQVIPTSINSSVLGATAPVKLPQPPAPTNYNGAVANGNAVIAANHSAFSADPATAAASTTPEDNLTTLFDKYLGATPTPPSATDIYASDYKGSGIDTATADLNAKAAATKAAQSKLRGITAQIEGLNAQATAEELKRDNRLAPTFAIAGEQGAIDRARAIKAIPLQVQALATQAELASAQGDEQLAQSILKQAQDHLDTVFQLHVQDATAQYNYKRDVVKSVYDFATDQEKRKLDTIQHKDDQAFQLKLEDIRQANDLEKMNLQASLTRRAVAGENGTINGKPQTTTQAQVQGYADRTSQADVTLSALGKKMAGFDLKTVVGQALPSFLNFTKTSEVQQYQQAQRNFVNAVLRRESGAVISPSEFDSARQQYFPIPGDTAETIKLKEQNRQTTINSLYQQSNVARVPLPGQIIQSGDQRFVVADDGMTLQPL